MSIPLRVVAASLLSIGLVGCVGLQVQTDYDESYDFSGRTSYAWLEPPVVEAPVYSHEYYDVIPGAAQRIERPDIVIVEGLNVLQTGPPAMTPFVSDYFDFTIYVDAEPDDLERWYTERFQQLRATAFLEQSAYFKQFAHLPQDAAAAVAKTIWRSINLVNLVENILPTRARADLVLRKVADHRIETIELRRT